MTDRSASTQLVAGGLAAATVAVLVGLRMTTSDEGAASRDRPQPASENSSSVMTRALPRVTPEVSAPLLREIAFEDVTDAVGLDYDPGAYDASDAFSGMTSAVALTRMQGRLTLLLTSPGGPVGLYQHDGTRFVDRTGAMGLDLAGPATAAGFADIDGDGDQDLVLGRQIDAVVSVYRNERGRFREVTRDAGVEPGSTSVVAGSQPVTRGLAFADVDKDGNLDFVVADWNPGLGSLVQSDLTDRGAADDDPDRSVCVSQKRLRSLPSSRQSQSRLYLGVGGGRFVDATQKWELGLDDTFAFSPQFVDLDRDGWQDLVVVGDLCSSRILRNDGGRGFVDVTRRTKPAMTPYGMGGTVTDLDGDGRADWLVSGIHYPTEDGNCPRLTLIAGCSGNRVFLGNRDGLTFTDATDETGLRDADWGWGVAAEDFANTGSRQVVFTNGYDSADASTNSDFGVFFQRFVQDPMKFYVQDAKGRYVDAAAGVGINDTGLGHGLVAIDYDEDGRLDLLVNNADTGPRLFRNVTPQRGRHQLTVRLRDATSAASSAGWGARVRVTSSEDVTTTGWITSSTSYMSQSLPELHFGLGAAAGPATVEVWWPGSTKVETFTDVRVDRTVTVRSGAGKQGAP